MEWEAGFEIMDSISEVDQEEYVDEIEDWKKQCERLREEAPTGLSRRIDKLKTGVLELYR